jgi:hypothetical protein
MSRVRLWRVASLLVVVVPLLAATQFASGAGVARSREKSGEGKAMTFAAGQPRQLQVVTENFLGHTSSTSYVTVPGATVTMNVPQGQQAVVVAQFSAESDCTLGATDDYCSIRMLITQNGVTTLMFPQSSFAVFDTVGTDGDLTEKGLTHTRVANVSAGPVTIFAEWRVSSSGTDFFIRTYSFKVEAWS